MAKRSYLSFSLVLVALVAVFALVACTPKLAASNDNATLPNLSMLPLPPAPVETIDGATTSTKDTVQTQETVEIATPSDSSDFAQKLSYVEGDRIVLKTEATSPDKVPVSLEYSSPFGKDGVWQTKVGDAGDYPVTITARDSRGLTASERILVTIKYANRAPAINGQDRITVKEGESIKLSYSATDPDGDDVVLSFSGWMKTDAYTTSFDDAGTHTVTVTASDSRATSRKDVTIVVENVNRAPVITMPKQMDSIAELQTFQLVGIKANDPDGDAVTISYGEPLDANGRWTPQYGDAGNRTAIITATDASGLARSVDVPIAVLAANRPPKISVPTSDEKVRVKEGERIDLRKALVVTDPEGAEIVMTYSGWMKSATYQTTYDDAGTHTVTVTGVDDHKLATSIDVTIVVDDVNRPPVFVRVA